MKLEQNAIEVVHDKLKIRIKEGMVILDATLGNGKDTIFLSKFLNSGKIYGFDIQPMAIDITRTKMEAFGKIIFLPILDSHENISLYIEEPLDLVLFNLGYLPGGDKNITTKWESTKIGIHQGLKLLKKEGLCSITCYPGHKEGEREWTELKAYIKSLDQKLYTVQSIDFPNQIHCPPKVIFIEKRK